MPDEFGNPTQEDWIMMILNGQGMLPGTNEDYSKDDLSGIKSQQTWLNQMPNLLGFDPISEYGGPEFEPYTAMSDILLEELPQDFTGNAVRASIEGGEGTLTIKQRLLQARDKYEETEGKEGISEEEYESYADWLEQFQQANARDEIEFSNRQMMETEGDPFGRIPLNPTPDEYIDTVRGAGAFDLHGPEGDTAQQYMLAQEGRHLLPWAEGSRRRVIGKEGPRPYEEGESTDTEPASAGIRKYYSRRGVRAKERQRRRPMLERANARAEQTLRRESERAQGASRPSAANDRARMNIRMFRMMMGLNPE